MRCHRAFRQLSTLFTKAGFPVLRFDYFGTGDSGGEGEQGTIDRWVDDVGTAIQELKDTAGVKRVSLIGLRLGATLALMCSEGRDDIQDLVCWDPIVDGKEYNRDLLRAAGLNGGPVSGTIGILGFPLTERMRADLNQLDLTKHRPGAKRPMVVVSSETSEYTNLKNSLESSPGFEYHHIPSEGNWNEVDNFGSMLLPQAIIQGIVASVTGEGR